MKNTERYAFEIGEEGLNYDILDLSYNEFTQGHILKNGLDSGMKVLDVGCGAGVMTAWLAQQVGPTGKVVAVDNSKEQLGVTQRRLQKLGLDNVDTQVLSAYELERLQQNFDVVYCRFLLHHLHEPRRALDNYYNMLVNGGIYFGHEGIVNSVFSYPDTFAWTSQSPPRSSPAHNRDSMERDCDFGLKLFYCCQQTGFTIKDCQMHQPVLWTKKQKERMLDGLIAFKKAELEAGMSALDWQKKYEETVRFINDHKQIIAFYNSCFVAAIK